MAYIVKRGDTLGRIAAKAGLTLRELLKLNPGIKDANKIGIGLKVELKAGKSTKKKKSSSSTGSSYTVVKGDTLNKIAAKAGLTLKELLKLNPGIKNPDRIGIGLKVVLGSKSAKKKAEKAKPIDVGGGVKVEKEKGKQKEQPSVGAKPKEGEVGLTILTSKEMVWYKDKATGKWYVEYGLPGSNMRVVFEAEPDQMDALFGKGMRPTNPTFISFKQLIGRANTTFSGNILDVEGKGTFEDHVKRVQALALDNGKLPDWAMKDGVAMDLLFIAQAENKGTEWLIDALSKTRGFKERFPQLDDFKGNGNLTTIEAIKGFLEYETGVKQALKTMGQDAIVTPALIGQLLTGGHSLTTIRDTVKSFRRLQKFEFAMNAFNDVLQGLGHDPITDIQDMLDFVSGNASQDIYDLYEASSIQEAALSAGLGDIFSVEDSIAAAQAGDFNLETATLGMRRASELLLRLRHEVDVGKFGLNHEELIDISLGQAPRSGRLESEILENINRAVLSAQGQLQKRAQPTQTFSRSGVPQTASLRNLRQTS